MSEKQVKTKKQIAQEFLKLTENGEVEKAFTLYVSDDFKHHNPRFRGDANSMKTALKKTASRLPELATKRLKILEDGDFVAIHSHIQVAPKSLRDNGLSYIHIFRFSKNKIIELWDFGQPIPSKVVNENGML